MTVDEYRIDQRGGFGPQNLGDRVATDPQGVGIRRDRERAVPKPGTARIPRAPLQLALLPSLVRPRSCGRYLFSASWI